MTLRPHISTLFPYRRSSDLHPPVDLDDDVRAWPPERQADVLGWEKQKIEVKYIILRVCRLDDEKKRQIETLLHERGLSDEGKIAYLRSLPPKQHYYLLKYAMSSERGVTILELLPQEIRTAYEQHKKGLFFAGDAQMDLHGSIIEQAKA